MGNDYSGAMTGIGIGLFVVAIVIYLATLVLAIWIGYLITRTAVKSGILLAMRQSGHQLVMVPQTPTQPPYTAPPQPGPPTQ